MNFFLLDCWNPAPLFLHHNPPLRFSHGFSETTDHTLFSQSMSRRVCGLKVNAQQYGSLGWPGQPQGSLGPPYICTSSTSTRIHAHAHTHIRVDTQTRTSSHSFSDIHMHQKPTDWIKIPISMWLCFLRYRKMNLSLALFHIHPQKVDITLTLRLLYWHDVYVVLYMLYKHIHNVYSNVSITSWRIFVFKLAKESIFNICSAEKRTRARDTHTPHTHTNSHKS